VYKAGIEDDRDAYRIRAKEGTRSWQKKVRKAPARDLGFAQDKRFARSSMPSGYLRKSFVLIKKSSGNFQLETDFVRFGHFSTSILEEMLGDNCGLFDDSFFFETNYQANELRHAPGKGRGAPGALTK
jgi:hypothetical protein